MYITIHCFEGDVAVCFDRQGRLFNIHLGELPLEAREGDMLEYDRDNGYLIVGSAASDHNARIADKRQRRFYDEN